MKYLDSLVGLQIREIKVISSPTKDVEAVLILFENGKSLTVEARMSAALQITFK
jgi:hypothetical protein